MGAKLKCLLNCGKVESARDSLHYLQLATSTETQTAPNGNICFYFIVEHQAAVDQIKGCGEFSVGQG